MIKESKNPIVNDNSCHVSDDESGFNPKNIGKSVFTKNSKTMIENLKESQKKSIKLLYSQQE